MKDVTSLISRLVYYGFDVNGNSVKRVVTKDVEPVLLNGLKQQGLRNFSLEGVRVCVCVCVCGGGGRGVGDILNSYKTFTNTDNTINVLHIS